MYTNMIFGAANAVLFIKVSSLQGVLIRGVPLYMYVDSIFVMSLSSVCPLPSSECTWKYNTVQVFPQ